MSSLWALLLGSKVVRHCLVIFTSFKRPQDLVEPLLRSGFYIEPKQCKCVFPIQTYGGTSKGCNFNCKA